jgi:hypothetical protein
LHKLTFLIFPCKIRSLIPFYFTVLLIFCI